MNFHNEYPHLNQSGAGAEPCEAEETLRLIARLPIPEGLEDRIQAGLLSRPRGARILAWPVAPRVDRGWMRSAAAAAIVFVVAGGGWGIYSHVQEPQPARVIVMPPHVSTPGGFSGAGAMRTPQTLNGPVVAHPVTAQPAQVVVPARTAKKPARRVPPGAANKTGVQPVTSAAK